MTSAALLQARVAIAEARRALFVAHSLTTTAQHTPSPWAFGDTAPRTRFAIRSTDGTVVAVASPLPHAPDFPERAGNAHLLAAAPDLLYALEDLLGDNPDVQGGVCRHCGRDYPGSDNDDMLTGDCPADDCPAYGARAAIAKARGRQ